MKLHLKAMICLLFVISVSSASLGWGTPGETKIAGRQVNVDLVEADDLTSVPWPDDHVGLITETLTTEANANIYDLLTANGILPDVEAFTVIYDLNPWLKQIDPLPSGVSLVLPKVTAGDKLQRKLKDGYLVMLTVDRTLREELATNISDLQNLSGRFISLSSERFTNPLAKKVMTDNVKAVTVWLTYSQKTFLQRTGPSLRRQTLLGLDDEALAINSILAAILGANEKVTLADQEQINAVYRDIQVQMKKYDNIMAGEPQVSDGLYKVVVTIRGGSAKLVEELQVYYAWEGLFRKPPKEPLKSQPFDGVGSGSTTNLTIADYVIWAGKPGHPFPPLTDQKPISIGATGGNPRNVTLTVIQ